MRARAAKAVDRLVLVTNRKHRRVEALQQFELQRVRILEFIDEDMLVAAVQGERDFTAGRFSESHGARDEIVVVGHAEICA